MANDGHARSSLWLEAATPAARVGVKGADSAQLLSQLGVAVPPRANSHTPLTADWRGPRGRCLRLGATEFLVEQDDDDTLIVALTTALAATPLRAFRAVRCDRSLVLRGANPGRVLLQVCSFDTTTFDRTPDVAVMTLLADITVTMIRDDDDQVRQPGIRLWCDPGYGDYLQDCLNTLLTAEGTPP